MFYLKFREAIICLQDKEEMMDFWLNLTYTMPEELGQLLWKLADTLRGKMDADDFRDYILGFIFYKYLSEKMEDHANKILKPDKLTYADLKKHKEKRLYLKEVKADALDSLGYFLEPNELFGELAERGNSEGKAKFILDDLTKILNHIEQSTMGTSSEEEFTSRTFRF